MQDEPETDEGSSRRSRDPEISTIEKIVRHLEDLDPNARRDVLAYLTRRFERVPSSIVRETSP